MRRVSKAPTLKSSIYDAVQSLPEMWSLAARRFASITAVHDPHSEPRIKLTYAQLYEQIQYFASGLQALGVGATSEDSIPPRVALFSDNSPRWLIANQGILRAGAVNVVRGAQASYEELIFILKHSGAIALFVQDIALLNKLRAALTDLPIRFVILLSDELPPEDTLQIISFTDALQIGCFQPLQPVQQTRETLATLMYTSGTLGMPKEVMLTHGSLMLLPSHNRKPESGCSVFSQFGTPTNARLSISSFPTVVRRFIRTFDLLKQIDRGWND